MPGVITGKHILYDASLLVNGVDVSTLLESVAFEVGINGFPAAAMGDIQDYENPGTQVITDPVATFYQDYNTAKVYATMFPLWQNRTVFNIVGKASSGARAPTNPEWTIPVFIKKEPLMTGKRGDRHMVPVTFGVAGAYSVLVA